MNCPGIISDQQRIGHVRHFGYHVVATEVMQFVIVTVACFGVGIVAYNMVTSEQIAAVVPETWDQLFFE